MDLSIFEVGPFAENTYLLQNEENALLIDPGFSQEAEFQSFRSGLSKELKAVILTHAHVDHVMGLSRVLREYQIPVYLSDKDYFLWENFESQSKMFGLNEGGFDFKPEVLPADDTFSIAGFTFQCLYTPGHSPDHISLYFPDQKLLIAGDALFKQSIGRTDLYKGSLDLLTQSIKNKLYTLPDETIVYPGHGPSTTIGEEKSGNSFVRI